MLPVPTLNAFNVYGPAFIYVIDNATSTAAFLGFCEQSPQIMVSSVYQDVPTASAGKDFGVRQCHVADTGLIDLPMNYRDDRVLGWTSRFRDIGAMSSFDRRDTTGLLLHFPQSVNNIGGYYFPSCNLIGSGIDNVNFAPSSRAFRYEAKPVRIKYDDEDQWVAKNFRFKKRASAPGIAVSALAAIGIATAPGYYFIVAEIPDNFVSRFPVSIPAAQDAPIIFSLPLPPPSVGKVGNGILIGGVTGGASDLNNFTPINPM